MCLCKPFTLLWQHVATCHLGIAYCSSFETLIGSGWNWRRGRTERKKARLQTCLLLQHHGQHRGSIDKTAKSQSHGHGHSDMNKRRDQHSRKQAPPSLSSLCQECRGGSLTKRMHLVMLWRRGLPPPTTITTTTTLNCFLLASRPVNRLYGNGNEYCFLLRDREKEQLLRLKAQCLGGQDVFKY